jgi:hypothetical protein
MTIFTSLDGREIELSVKDDKTAYKLDMLMYRVLTGYNHIRQLKGAPGLTELCMHVGCSYKNGIVAFTNEQATYAYVLFEDGSVTDGSFHQFKDGTWNIS